MAAKQYDVHPQVVKDAEEKAKRRAALKREYFKQITDPFKHGKGEGGYLFDSGLQRFMSMRATGYEYFRPTPRSGAFAFGLVIAPIAIYTWLIKMHRDSVEKKLRSGEVAYKDRKFKFI